MTREQRKAYNAALKRTPAEVAAAVGVSQLRLAREFFISRRTWGDWSTGKSKRSPYEWLAIQHVLGLYDHPAARPESDLATDNKEIALSRTSAEISAAVGTPRYKIAEELFVPRGTSEDWSTGERNPIPHMWLALQAVLGLYRHPAAALRKHDAPDAGNAPGRA